MQKRTANVERKSNETDIKLSLNIDGTGVATISTGYGMADHLLTLIAFWAKFDLDITCTGDLHIDAHHTVEDIGLCFGKALLESLGDRKGIQRVGSAKVPMDEAIADVALDLSGRAYCVYIGDNLLPPMLAGEESDLWREFFKSFAAAAHMNLHINYLYGKNGHHLIESAGKGLGLALRDAVKVSSDIVSSTKGRLD